MSVTLTIDGRTVTVPQGTTVYHAVKSLGIDLPIFCYQDRMPPFGACRVCLVEVEKMPKLQTSCTLVAQEGMVVKTQSQLAVEGREGIIEFLLINHPLDCPICDRGGECPLQEQTLKFGSGNSRFYEEKRHFTKAKPLGPVLMLDRERCIVCARCTRFSDIVSKDSALQFIDRGFKTEVGTPDGGPAESKFIGNTIMICPVGALTSNVYRFRARPWDNASTNSTCTLCPVGCSLILDTRDGEIMRTRSREDKKVNDIWLCDKGWFGYEFSSSEKRLKYPLLRKGESLSQVSWNEALEFVARKFNLAKETGKLAAWGGNPLTVEENYLFQRLFRERGGVDHVDHRIGEPLFSIEEEGLAPGMDIELDEVEDLKTVYLLGVDLTEEFPIIWLRLSQAINKGAKVTFIGHFGTEISRHLDKVILHEPGHALDHLKNLEFKDKSAIFIGRQYLSSPSRKAVLAFIKKEYPGVSLNILEGSGNSVGARWAGMRPDVGPLGRPLVKKGLNPRQVLEKGLSEGWDFLYVAGANPALKFPSSEWKNFTRKLGCLVVQDIFLTETAHMADVVLPTLSFVEKGGSFINIEGRVQTLMPGKVSRENLFSDSDLFMKVAERLNYNLKMDSDLIAHLSKPKITLNRPEKIEPQNIPQTNELSLYFSVKLFDEGVRMRESKHVIELAKK
ncbi:MAG: NADH-quinone oxidoreductase subunit NuoG, partial [Parachlamydiaceae bacterium]